MVQVVLSRTRHSDSLPTGLDSQGYWEISREWVVAPREGQKWLEKKGILQVDPGSVGRPYFQGSKVRKKRCGHRLLGCTWNRNQVSPAISKRMQL